MKKGFIVYGIEFSNGDLYIGSTRDLTKRMYEHKFRSKKSDLPLYVAMRTQDFYEFVIMEDIATRKEAYELERRFTQLYKHMGHSLVNKNNVVKKVKVIKVDGRKSEDYRNKRRGKGNPNSKPMQYFAVTSTQRGCFKNVCKNQGWNFDNFLEILDTRNKGKFKKFFYIYKGEAI